MSYFTAACATQGALLTRAERREVVVEQEFFSLAHQCAINELLVELRTQRQRGQTLRFTARENGRTVATREVVYFRPDWTDFSGLPAVKT